MAAPAPCARCGGETEMVHRDTGGASGPVEVRVERRPLRRCDEGHELEAASGLDDRLRSDALDELPIAGRSLLLRPDRCGHCDTALSLPARWTTRSVSLVAPDVGGVVTFTFDVPMTRCPECATGQVPRSALADVRAALDAAMVIES